MKKKKEAEKEIRISKRGLKKLYWTCQENVEKHCSKMNYWIDQRNHWQEILKERYGLLA